MSQQTAQAGLINKVITLGRLINQIKNWPSYIADYCGLLGNKKHIYLLRNGVVYKVRSGSCDRGILNEIWLRRDYEKLIRYLNKDSIVIDLGAQIGIFSIYVAKQVGCSVIAYEPFPENYQMLKDNILENNTGDSIAAYEMAISDHNGTTTLYVSDNNTGGHSVIAESDHKIDVLCATLEDVFSENRIECCDLLKIDVEGSEYKILYSAPREILERIKNIVIEVHEFSSLKGYNHSFLIEFLQGQGMLCNWRPPYLYCSRQ